MMNTCLSFASRRTMLALTLLTSLALGACGGGVGVSGDGYYVGGGYYDSYGDDFTRPSVSIAVSEGLVRPGQTIRVVAAASDASGIDSVTLYRQDFGGDRLLSSLGRGPYEWLVAVPNDGRGSVTYYVQAVDNAGNRANSNTVTITIMP